MPPDLRTCDSPHHVGEGVVALGGTDTDGNVQPLCGPCHKLKTREDFGAAGPPF
ncbi:HNH endonuclease [Streptomyces virginiae]|uniref:HNH endonuclease n=1 Tax=Streptomyces virginiae TaxID=1961 RepID=UPI003699648C